MHFTEPVYRNPYWPTWPLLEITRGCAHNRCKFCTMYKGVRFGVASLAQIEEDLRELAASVPHARTIQLLSANPLALTYDKLASILEKIHEYLPQMEHVYTVGRVSDLRNKTVEQLRALRDLSMDEISLGTESGDDWTLDRINKGYHAADIIEQCAKLDEAGIRYWHSFLNGVAGRSHSHEHAINSAHVFSQTNPLLVGVGGLTLFPGTPLRDEAERQEFRPALRAGDARGAPGLRGGAHLRLSLHDASHRQREQPERPRLPRAQVLHRLRPATRNRTWGPRPHGPRPREQGDAVMDAQAFNRNDTLFSLCGLNCSLCPLFVRSDCTGCRAGSWCATSCQIVPCSVRHGGISYCFECASYPCTRYEGIDRRDSLISHRNQLKDMDKARLEGIESYRERQREKASLLRHLLERFDDGTHDVFFCLAANMLEADDLRTTTEHVDGLTKSMDIHERAACLAGELRRIAAERDIPLELRTWDGPW